LTERSLGEQTASLLQDLIRFDTVNPPGNEHEAQAFLKSYLEAAGFDCELVGASPERPNLIGRLSGSDSPSEDRRLCYLGHVDTVLADPSEWSVDPWSGALRDGYVWGRGALDMKGQVASEVTAAAALARDGWRPTRGELMVVVTCDEEAGAEQGAQWLCREVPEKVRCDWVVNEGAGEAVDFAGRRYFTLCVGEKGVFRFTLTTEGRAGHASMPKVGDNALLRMVKLLGRLDGRQPPLDRYPEGELTLEALLGRTPDDVAEALAEVRAAEPELADYLEPTLGVTIVPTMAHASDKENVIPSRCSVKVDCRVPPGLGTDHARARVEQLLGPVDGDVPYILHFDEHVVGSSSVLEGPLAEAIDDFARSQHAPAGTAPLVLPGFTDSHWFRTAFPDCIAYGFFPQHAMTLFETTPLVHAPDERIAVADLELASNFFYELARRMLR
jgi:acetylornithine deacetylase/succinyl-diaminopimelate desuccinylase-like protein